MYPDLNPISRKGDSRFFKLESWHTNIRQILNFKISFVVIAYHSLPIYVVIVYHSLPIYVVIVNHSLQIHVVIVEVIKEVLLITSC